MTRSTTPPNTSSTTSSAEVIAPRAARRPHLVELHGETLQDDYAWLRNRRDPEVLDYLRAENEHTDAWVADDEDLQERLYQEMRGRIQEDDSSVPVELGGYLYYQRIEEGRQYPFYCRRADRPDAEEEVLLDLDALAEDGDYLSLGVYRISPNHKLLAYSLDLEGSERYVLRVKDLETGEDLAERIEDTSDSAEWVDDQTLIYCRRDAAERPYRAYLHGLGDETDDDRLLYEESDERFFLTVDKTRSRRFVVLSLATHSTTELHVLDVESADLGFRLLAPRRKGVQLSVDHHGDRFLLRTNDGAGDFRLMEVPIGGREPSEEPTAGREVLPERPSVVIEGIACFREHLVLEVRRRGLRRLEIYSLASGAEPLADQEPVLVDFDEPVYTVRLNGNPRFDAPSLRFAYTSFLTPRSIYEYDFADGERRLLKRDPVPGFEPEEYVSERLFARTEGGAELPISLVRRKSTAVDGEAPLLLYGYGSYGTSIEPRFSITRLSLLDRGFVYAVAHVRGGGALGRSWYEAGKLADKPSTFSDFETAAEHLVEQGYTRPRRLLIRGASAGGLLIGAVINRRPELFHAALAEVPFVDVLHTMLDPSIPLTVIEYDEWGNPGEDEKAFRWIRSYSPYENVRPAAYPHLLVTAGLHDPRVQYWEPAKWVAKLRAHKTDQNLLFLQTDMGSGHGGASGRYDSLRQEAFKYAFLIRALHTDRSGASRSGASRSDASRSDASRSDASRSDASRSDDSGDSPKD